ncbi:MAG: hypothetical protein KF894_19835 [Labilithrix sp.]|nr:hypothetical protein [Labilithrix sp.]
MKTTTNPIRRVLARARHGIAATGVACLALAACDEASEPSSEASDGADAGDAVDAAGPQADAGAAADAEGGGDAPRKRCRVISEVRNEIGNPAFFFYTYDAEGVLERATKGPLKQYEAEILTSLDVGHDLVRESAQPRVELKMRYDAKIRSTTLAKPSRSNLDLIMGTTPMLNAYTYEYEYDTKDRLVRVSEYTPENDNDSEGDVVIKYDDKDNVVRLEHALVRGPLAPGEVMVTVVKGYDDKPTPYALVPNYRFALTGLKHRWNEADLEGFVTALSKNNPLEIVDARDTAAERTRTMTYEYNESGYPTRRTNAIVAPQSSKQYTDEFAYECE